LGGLVSGSRDRLILRWHNDVVVGGRRSGLALLFFQFAIALGDRIAPSELVRLRRRGARGLECDCRFGPEAPAVLAGLDDIAVVGQAIEQTARPFNGVCGLGDHQASNERSGTSE